MMQFILDPEAGVPFYRQIIDQIIYEIASGILKTGDQLPTVRALAVELKVNLNTVTKAYKELEFKTFWKPGRVRVHS
jgi:GntR family transcriptional regulator